MTPFQLISGIIGVWFFMTKIKKQVEDYPNAVYASPHFKWTELIVSRGKPALAAKYRAKYPAGRWPFFLDQNIWAGTSYKYSEVLAMVERKDVYSHLLNQPISANMVDHLTNVVEPLRAFLGHPLTVSSGWRPPELNAALGGGQAKWSGHLMGVATDILANAADRARAEEWARANKEKVGYFHGYSSFFHIASPRWPGDHTFK